VEINDRFVELGGLAFHYREAGDPAGHAVVLLHALGCGCDDWDDVVRDLADRHRMLAFELRGSHRSARAGAYSFELMRDDVRAFADRLELERFSLAGHSMGGSVAYLFAEAWPERLDRLVVEDTPPPWHRAQPIAFGEAPADLPFDIAMARAIVDQLNAPDPAWWESLDRITTPTLILAGGPDSHVPQDRIAVAAARIPDCRLVTLGGGHHVHRERRDEFVEAVRSFLD
jgi:pimeloyl-ACP methyl ester carboxylesterase